MFQFIFSQAVMYKELGLMILRVAIGLMFMIHGGPKLMGGSKTWLWLGSQMQVFGITFLPVFWGFAAAFTEFVGGLALAVGFCSRIAAFLLACVMFVAVCYHLNKGDAFMEYSHALSMLVVFIALFVTGPGIYSLDAWWCS